MNHSKIVNYDQEQVNNVTCLNASPYEHIGSGTGCLCRHHGR